MKLTNEAMINGFNKIEEICFEILKKMDSENYDIKDIKEDIGTILSISRYRFNVEGNLKNKPKK